jgi:hypothetical protein
MDPAGWYWLGWLLVAFLPMELYAAFATPGRGDTFSEWVWWAFGVKPRKDGKHVRWARLRRAILAAFLLSLTGHLVMGWTVLPVAVFGAGVAAVIVYAVGWEGK